MKRAIAILAWVMIWAPALPALAQAEMGKQAPDFPPGLFDDGNHYSLNDLEGKAVVLFFYEQDCPRCREMIPERNAVIARFADKPIKFIGVAAGDTMVEARSYLTSTHLAMPVFADTFSLMEKRYGTRISLQNIWQFRVIGPDGSVVGYSMDADKIEQALASVKWKYKDDGYDQRLAQAVDRFEWGLYADGMRLLRPHLKSTRPEVKESAHKLYEKVKAQGEAWVEKADKALEANPIEAYDLYAKVASAFAGEEMGKKAAESLKKLAASRAVKDELSARRMYEQLCEGIGRARANDREDVRDFAASIARKFPDSPTGQRAAKVAQEL